MPQPCAARNVMLGPLCKMVLDLYLPRSLVQAISRQEYALMALSRSSLFFVQLVDTLALALDESIYQPAVYAGRIATILVYAAESAEIAAG